MGQRSSWLDWRHVQQQLINTLLLSSHSMTLISKTTEPHVDQTPLTATTALPLHAQSSQQRRGCAHLRMQKLPVAQAVEME